MESEDTQGNCSSAREGSTVMEQSSSRSRERRVRQQFQECIRPLVCQNDIDDRTDQLANP